MRDIFPLNTSFVDDVRNWETFPTRTVKSVYEDTKSLSFLVTKMRELYPESIESIDSLPVFNKTMKV